MSDFTPKTRLEKILCGVVTTAKTRLEKAVKYAVEHAGGGGGGAMFVSLEESEGHLAASASVDDICEAYKSGPVFIKFDGNLASVFEADDSNVKAVVTFPADGELASMYIYGHLGSSSQEGAPGDDQWEVRWEYTGTSPFEVNATRSVDSETQKETISFDKTAEELYGAVTAGKLVLMKTSITDDEATITIDTVLSVTAKKILIPDETPGVTFEMYEFNFVDMDKEEGTELYCAPELSGDDYVVFSRISGN